MAGGGFRRFLGNAGETDMLMRNSNTGAFEIYDISQQHDHLGCADGPGRAGMADGRRRRSATDGARREAQLAQAMASYAPAGAPLADAGAPGPVGATQTMQQTSLLTAPRGIAV